MSANSRFVFPYQTAFDVAGVPIPGARLNFYLTGSSTRAPTYSNAGLTVANANPVPADDGGVFPNIFLNPELVYKVVLTGPLPLQTAIWTADPVQAADFADIDLANVAGVDFAAKAFIAQNGQTASDLFQRFGHHLNIVDDFGASTGSADNAVAIQAALTYCRTNSQPLGFPAGNFLVGSGLTINNTTDIDKALIIQGAGYDASPTLGGSCLYFPYSATVPLLTMSSNGSSGNQDGSVEWRNFAVQMAGAASAAGADNISLRYVNNTVLWNLFSGYSGGNGLIARNCFVLAIYHGLYFGNFKSGIAIETAGNRVKIENVIAFQNGQDVTTQDQANIIIRGSPTNQGPSVINCDVSYSGKELMNWGGTGGAKTITSISVTGGVATVTCTAHGLVTGNLVSITLQNTVGLGSLLFGKVVTRVSANVFTYVCTAANGAYTILTDPTLRIGTQSSGLFIVGSNGVLIESLYCENPMGFAAYIGSNVNAFTFNGGFILNGFVQTDTSTNGEIGGMVFQGPFAGLLVSELDHRATVNVKSSNKFIAGAQLLLSSYYMMDGARYGPAAPATGTWTRGEMLFNSQPAAGQPKGWVCTASGTPGTFVSMGNL